MSQPTDVDAALKAAIEAKFDDYFVQNPANKTAFNIAAIIAVVTQLVSAAPAIMAMIQQLLAIFKKPTPGPTPVPGSAPVGSAPDLNVTNLQS